MQPSRARLLHETLRRYVRRRAHDHLDKLIAKTRDEELAEVMESMGEDDQLVIFGRLSSPERRAHVIVLMEPPFAQRVLDPMPTTEAAAILKEMAQDDAADILSDLTPEQSSGVLEILEASEEVESLMLYGEDTAGGIMVPEFVALDEDTTAEEAISSLREQSEVEMVYYIYVVNEHGHLVGVLSLRRLVVAPPHTRIRDVMETDVLSVTTDTDQEEVARLVARYGFLSVPVTDESNKLLGLVTVDDVIDVLHDEATEDMLKMAGAGDNLAETAGITANVRIRFPWLLASCAGGLLGAAVMGVFEDTLRSHTYLAFFLPVVLGMSGNVGTQAATVTVRAIALGRISYYSGVGVVRRELLIGLALGILYGLIVGAVAALFIGNIVYGAAIGLSIGAGMTVASTVGAAIPIGLSRLNIDPAIATGPIVTTVVDILGILSYFAIAVALMRVFLGLM